MKLAMLLLASLYLATPAGVNKDTKPTQATTKVPMVSSKKAATPQPSKTQLSKPKVSKAVDVKTSRRAKIYAQQLRQEQLRGKIGTSLASSGRFIRVKASAYSGNCPIQHTGDRTATGTCAKYPGIAVDPRVIPLGSIIELNGVLYLADDTGGAIKGSRVDLRVADYRTAIRFGRKTLTAKVYAPVKCRVKVSSKNSQKK